jgi:hypothetical protein
VKVNQTAMVPLNDAHEADGPSFALVAATLLP